MKFVRFRLKDKVSYGIQEEDIVREITGSIFGDFQVTPEKFSLGEVDLLAPVEPSKVLCVGLNFRDHIADPGDPTPGGVREKGRRRSAPAPGPPGGSACEGKAGHGATEQIILVTKDYQIRPSDRYIVIKSANVLSEKYETFVFVFSPGTVTVPE